MHWPCSMSSLAMQDHALYIAVNVTSSKSAAYAMEIPCNFAALKSPVDSSCFGSVHTRLTHQPSTGLQLCHPHKLHGACAQARGALLIDRPGDSQSVVTFPTPKAAQLRRNIWSVFGMGQPLNVRKHLLCRLVCMQIRQSRSPQRPLCSYS